MSSDDKRQKDKKAKKKKQSGFSYWWKWPLIVLIVAFCLSLAFGVLSEFALSGAGLAVSIVVIVVFIIIAILTDMIGVAVTAASIEPFRAMAAKKVRGAKESIKLIQNADKVASLVADVIGDICGILSGAAGATVAIAFITSSTTSFMEILIASLVSAIIAALTIFGKAFFKKYAMNHSERIVLIIGKFISIFHPQKRKEGGLKKKNDKQEIEGQEKATNTTEETAENKDV